MNHYFLEKLSGINYRMSVNEGNANQRLASEAENIVVFPAVDVPIEYRDEFVKLKKILNASLDNVKFPLTISRIRGIYNVTAAKYIKLLIDIEYRLSNEDCDI